MTATSVRRAERSHEAPSPKTACATAQKSILLIEDNEEAMFLVRCAFQEHGMGNYRLEWAQGLSAGLERIEKGGIDLVLLDLGLPESSGPASYSWVRQVAVEIPVLVLTGDIREETEWAVAACGVEDYLIKDQISGALLVQAIRAALRTGRRAERHKSSLAEAAEPEDEFTPSLKIRRFVPLKPGQN